jgi:hypothetical protein
MNCRSKAFAMWAIATTLAPTALAHTDRTTCRRPGRPKTNDFFSHTSHIRHQYFLRPRILNETTAGRRYLVRVGLPSKNISFSVWSRNQTTRSALCRRVATRFSKAAYSLDDLCSYSCYTSYRTVCCIAAYIWAWLPIHTPHRFSCVRKHTFCWLPSAACGYRNRLEFWNAFYSDYTGF